MTDNDNNDLDDAKKYLEEVMGIVEDEKFRKKRNKKHKSAQTIEHEIIKDENIPYVESWFCTKVIYFMK